MGELERQLVAHIERHGPIGFDEYQHHALYAPDLGFYAGGGGAGRRRDFLTSPEVGPLFGAVIGRALDRWWDDLGRPDPYSVVEAGAGPGTLARAVLASQPRCSGALELTLVEVAEVQWATHPAEVRSRPDLPGAGELGPGPVVVLANELLDNLPVALAERSVDGWHEVVVAAQQGRLIEARRELGPVQQAWCAERAPAAGPGARLPIQAEAAAWLADAIALSAGGTVAVVDYGRTTAAMAARPWHEWLRTYAAHGRRAGPLEAPGSCDITCDVALDQLALVAAPTEVVDQATFLRAHGIDELVDEGRATWDRLGLGGGLAAIEGRSRTTEAEALGDPAGLGGFVVARWST